MIDGDHLRLYSTCNNPTTVRFPSQYTSEEVIVCRRCQFDWKALLQSNTVEQRPRVRSTTIKRLTERFRKKDFYASNEPVAQLFCTLCKATGRLRTMNGVWKPRIISKVPNRHRNEFFTALALKFRAHRDIMSHFVFHSDAHVVCSHHTSHIFKLTKNSNSRYELRYTAVQVKELYAYRH